MTASGRIGPPSRPSLGREARPVARARRARSWASFATCAGGRGRRQRLEPLGRVEHRLEEGPCVGDETELGREVQPDHLRIDGRRG